VATEAEIYRLKALAEMKEKAATAYFNPPSVPPMTNTEFYAHIGESKTNTGNIVDEEIRPSSPAFDETMFTFGDPEIDVVHEKFHEISRMFGRISPHQSTNPEVLVTIAQDFFSSFISSNWALVPIKGMSIKGMLTKHFKRVSFKDPAPSTAPPPAPEAMEVDLLTPYIPAELKDKGKAVPPPAPPKAAAPVKPASPIKISAVPRPFPQPGPSKAAASKGNCAPAWVAKLSGKNMYKAHFDSVTQATLKQGKPQMCDTQSVPQASQAVAPQRDYSSARILSDNSSSRPNHQPPESPRNPAPPLMPL
jgi:hypothetical protein